MVCVQVMARLCRSPPASAATRLASAEVGALRRRRSTLGPEELVFVFAEVA